MAIDPDSLDQRMRLAAFAHVRALNEMGAPLSSATIAKGFVFEGQRVPLVNPQRGIFKPKQMRHLLSIRTVYPRSGARVWYDDQREVHRQLYTSVTIRRAPFLRSTSLSGGDSNRQ